MRITIDTDILDKEGLTLTEFMLLYVGALNINIVQHMQTLIDKGFAYADPTDNGKLIVDRDISQKLFNITIDSDKKVIDKESEYLTLAKKLQAIYPQGKKPGTNYMWRGTALEVARKLKILVVKYNCKFTEDQAIKATEDYIKSFNGDFTKMRLLKYFIVKLDRDADGNVSIVSDFMSLIENEGQEDVNNDWSTQLV